MAVVAGGAVSGSAQTGPKLDNGVGTAEALDNPNCDPETRRIRLYSVFRVPCVKKVKAEDNGGATSRGVTRDAIKVVMVTAADPNSVPKDPSIAAQNGVNQATGITGIYADAVRDANELYVSVYETYGRELDIEIYTRTGIDEASMRADALAIVEKKPFAVLNAEPPSAAPRRSQDHHVRLAERPEGHRAPGAVPVVVVDRLLRDDPHGRGSAGQAGLGRQGEVGG